MLSRWKCKSLLYPTRALPNTYRFLWLFAIQVIKAKQTHTAATTRARGAADDEGFPSKEISSTFKEWFSQSKSRTPNKRPLTPFKLDVKRVCDVLSVRQNADTLEQKLSDLNVRLSDKLVIRVLQFQRNLLIGLRFFEWAALQVRYDHMKCVYPALFRLMSKAKGTPELSQWLHSFRKTKRGLVMPDATTYSQTLFMGYAIQGNPDAALRVLSTMRFKGFDFDKYTYRVLINAMLAEGCYELVEVLYSHIERAGFHDRRTCYTVINALCEQGKLDQAVGLYDRVKKDHVKKGRLVNDDTLRLLVGELCKNGKYEEALGKVEEFRREGRGCLSRVYDSYLLGLLEGKRIEAAYSFFKERVGPQYRPRDKDCNLLADSLVKRCMLKEVFELLMEMREMRMVPNLQTMDVAMMLFCKAGMTDVALDVFNSDDYKCSDEICSELVFALCRCRRADKAFEVMHDSVARRLKLSRFSLRVLELALCDDGKLDEMMELVDIRLELYGVSDAITSRKLMIALCQSGRLDDACFILSKVKGNTHVFEDVYAHIIEGFCRTNMAVKASKMLLEMWEDGHPPLLEPYKSVIASLCSTGYESWIPALLDMFVGVRSPNAEMFNCFINGLCSINHLRMATTTFEKMIECGCQPTVSTHICLLDCYLENTTEDEALVFFQTKLSTCNPTTMLYDGILRVLCEKRNIKLCLMMFQEMNAKGLVPTLWSYERLIFLLCKQKEFALGLRIYKDMKQKGRPACPFIYIVLLQECCREGDIEMAWHIFEDMCVQKSNGYFDILPIFVKGLSDAKHLESGMESLEYLIDISFGPNIINYNLLLKCLFKERKLELASDVFSRLPNKGCIANMWTYDILIQGFCEAGRVSDAKSKLDEMIKKGFQPSRATYNFFTSLTNKYSNKNCPKFQH